MTRVVSVGRSQGLFLASTLGIAMLFSLTGCPGTLENPGAFPPPVSGAAGTGGGAAGTGGPAGTGGGMAGTGGGCDVKPLFTAMGSKYGCNLDGACHDAAGSAGNFSMTAPNWETMLVGVMPKGGGTSMCGGSTKPYLIKGSNPAAGLFMDKLTTPTCGMMMPELTGPISSADMTCIKAWAQALVNQ